MAIKNKDVECIVERPFIEQHEIGGEKLPWWLVTVVKKNGRGSFSLGFSTEADAKNAIALHRSLEANGYVSRSAIFKLVRK